MDEIEQKRDEVKTQIETYGSIEAVANSRGGKVIIKSLKKDIVSGLDELCNKFKVGSHVEIIAIIAKLSERLNILRTLTRAEKNKKVFEQELAELISE